MAEIVRHIFMEHTRFFIACAKLKFVQWELGLSSDWGGRILHTLCVFLSKLPA